MANENHPGPITRSMGENVMRYSEVGSHQAQFHGTFDSMDDDNFDCRSVHSDMDRIEYNKIKGKENTTKVLTQSRCQSESGLIRTSMVRNDDFRRSDKELEALKSENRSLVLDIYHLRKQVDSSTHELETVKTNTWYDKGSDLKEYQQVNYQYQREIEELQKDLAKQKEINDNNERSKTGMHEANRSSFMYEYNHGQGTSNSYSEYRVNNVSDRNYNLQYEHPVTSITGTNSSGSHPDEPKFRLPYYNGKSDFQSFWSVFEIGVRKFNWDNSKQVEKLMCCLKDDALAYVSKLPSEVRRSIKHTYELLERRYGDHLLPEQYREKLNHVRKEYKEGLPDQSLAYEVRTKGPHSVDEAIKLITWHECCKNSGKKTSSVRQLEMEETEEYTDLEVRKVNGGRPRFVTEERLESRLGVFAKEIQHEIKDGHTQLRNDFKDEIGKLSTAIKGNYPNKNARYRKQNDSPKFSLKDTTCFTLSEKRSHQ
ncbi:unnamed protein product [Mytilus coruscus]|uniref:Uncharacterized protein n=1 Tax=Mytilus coruscus TaxID=42192 RepID=A0A6J8C9X8_MYTCO|nr:unnamed protein product [Mytilus coruscus]